MTVRQMNIGLKALDSVKHCQDQMNAIEKANDKQMRNTAPIKWKIGWVALAVKVSERINKSKK